MFNYNEINSKIKLFRSEIHRHPETGYKEFLTSAYISKRLRELGLEVIDGITGTGVIGILKGNEGNYSVAVRADMDALEVTEETNLTYASEVPGVMHACGHDGHVAALLGLAEILINDRSFKNNIILIFQPAEEGPGGAKPIVESGLLNKYNIKAILAMHVFPEEMQGMIACCEGPMTAMCAEIDIDFIGKSAHGAQPDKGIDSILAASEFVTSIQSIVSRRLDPRDGAVVTFGKIYGGEVRNIIAGCVRLEGTMRAFTEENYNLIKETIQNTADGIQKIYGLKAKVTIRDMYPSVYNNEELFTILNKVVEKEKLHIIKPLMIAEDFSYYKKAAPTLMFMLGSRNAAKGYIYPLHNSKFNFDEDILIDGVTIFYNMLKELDA